jgi:iron complex transport system substrate-binding protein
VDAEGREVRLDAPATRVVSLVPSVTEVILAIGAEDRLVGRTDYDVGSALAALPSVGGGLGPNLEALAALEPDLVIRFGGDSDRVTPERLDDLGVAHLAVRPDRIDDLWTILDQVGAVLALGQRTDSLRRLLADGLDRIALEVAGRPPVRVAYLMGGSPPWTAGEGTYIDELITLAGGTNVLADVGGLYGAVSPEVVATRPVDVILLADGADIDRRLLDGRTVRTLSEVVQLPGPRIVEAAREVVRAVHGEAGAGR